VLGSVKTRLLLGFGSDLLCLPPADDMWIGTAMASLSPRAVVTQTASGLAGDAFKDLKRLQLSCCLTQARALLRGNFHATRTAATVLLISGGEGYIDFRVGEAARSLRNFLPYIGGYILSNAFPIESSRRRRKRQLLLLLFLISASRAARESAARRGQGGYSCTGCGCRFSSHSDLLRSCFILQFLLRIFVLIFVNPASESFRIGSQHVSVVAAAAAASDADGVWNGLCCGQHQLLLSHSLRWRLRRSHFDRQLGSACSAVCDSCVTCLRDTLYSMQATPVTCLCASRLKLTVNMGLAQELKNAQASPHIDQSIGDSPIAFNLMTAQTAVPGLSQLRQSLSATQATAAHSSSSFEVQRTSPTEKQLTQLRAVNAQGQQPSPFNISGVRCALSMGSLEASAQARQPPDL
uniref:Mediator of RNA polymerase II transcription subunit 25 n=1 Tax=Macrostomum lignano TaxID=282301 RepID=A0A1I8FIW1_9PLAT